MITDDLHRLTQQIVSHVQRMDLLRLKCSFDRLDAVVYDGLLRDCVDRNSMKIAYNHFNSCMKRIRQAFNEHVDDMIVVSEFQRVIKRLQKRLKKRLMNNNDYPLQLGKSGGKHMRMHPISRMRLMFRHFLQHNQFIELSVKHVFSVDELRVVNIHDLTGALLLNDNAVLKMMNTVYMLRIQQLLTESFVDKMSFFSTGVVYRKDNDSTHLPCFNQIDVCNFGMNLTIFDLIHFIKRTLKLFIADEQKIRIRPHYFPYTYKSVEIDLTCSCKRRAVCTVCELGGSVEILGAGMIRQTIIRRLHDASCNQQFNSGWAFGLGIERLFLCCNRDRYNMKDLTYK